MIEGSITQRWARALLELAQEENKLADFREQLNRFADLLAADGGKLGGVLESPSFSAKEKVAIVSDLAAAQNMLPSVKNFLAFAMEKNRGRYVVPIVQAFNRMADDLTGVVKAELTVAADLGAAARDRIRAALEKATKKKVDLDVKIDPALIGGAVVRLGSLIVDGSLRTQLDELSRNLAHVE